MVGARSYVLRVYVRGVSVDFGSEFWKTVSRAMKRIGIEEPPNDVELGCSTVVLVYRDERALKVLKQVKHHFMCRKRVIDWDEGLYACFDSFGEPFWVLSVFGARKRVPQQRR